MRMTSTMSRMRISNDCRGAFLIGPLAEGVRCVVSGRELSSGTFAQLTPGMRIELGGVPLRFEELCERDFAEMPEVT